MTGRDSLTAGTGGARPLPPSTATGQVHLRDAALYVSAGTQARLDAEAIRATRPGDAALLDRIAQQPSALWLGGWMTSVRTFVATAMGTARTTGALPVFVAYNIPGRDCGSYSAGGADGATAYAAWIRDIAAGMAGRPAVVVLEPDAVAGLDCLSPAGASERLAMLSEAAQSLRASGALVYIDAGNPRWQPVGVMAARLATLIPHADGFSLNVSNTVPVSENLSYGRALAGALGGAHFVVDVSRAGTPSTGGWCNPMDAALGTAPTTRAEEPLADALLWIKPPGESDGPCNGGPTAGTWWRDYALALVRHQDAARTGIP